MSRRMRCFLTAGAAVGVLGVAAFGLVHALLIVPIWARLPGGLPAGVGAGMLLGWAFCELQAGGRWSQTPRAGLLFGLLMWGTLLPMTTFGAIVRAAGLHGTDDMWEVVAECVLVFATGAFGGRLVGGHWRAAWAVGTASVGLTLAMGGPIPIANSARGALLFAAFAGLYAACGLALAVTASTVMRAARVHSASSARER